MGCACERVSNDTIGAGAHRAIDCAQSSDLSGIASGMLLVVVDARRLLLVGAGGGVGGDHRTFSSSRVFRVLLLRVLLLRLARITGRPVSAKGVAQAWVAIQTPRSETSPPAGLNRSAAAVPRNAAGRASEFSARETHWPSSRQPCILSDRQRAPKPATYVVNCPSDPPQDDSGTAPGIRCSTR